MRAALWPDSPEDHEPVMTAFSSQESPIAVDFSPCGRVDGSAGLSNAAPATTQRAA
jgi:hypothetical protein